jgi:hypothetical protein
MFFIPISNIPTIPIIPIFILAICWSFSLPAEEVKAPLFPVEIQQNEIHVQTTSPFLHYLEIHVVEEEKLKGHRLLEVGQIVAHFNPGSGPVRNSSWVELDVELSKRLGLDFKARGLPHGSAVGLVMITQEHAVHLKQGSEARVVRYGLTTQPISGQILQIRELPQTDLAEVLFVIPKGQEFLPGSACEVEFPVVQINPVSLPSTSLIHVNSEEYVLKEIAAGVFVPKHVSILEEEDGQVTVAGGINPGDRVITRGAILLKPQIQTIFQKEKP